MCVCVCVYIYSICIYVCIGICTCRERKRDIFCIALRIITRARPGLHQLFNLKAYLGYSSMKRIRVETMNSFSFLIRQILFADSATPGLHQQAMLFSFASLLYASTFMQLISRSVFYFRPNSCST